MESNLTWDDTKRTATLINRGIDFADAESLFCGPIFEFEDMRQDYGERRMICFGRLAGRLMAVGYVQRGEKRHIFSMRKANEREQDHFEKQFEKN